jgi:hypothetical protein
MRCATCGTDNTPDSKFCGGCGARVMATGKVSNVAPTQKISDDVKWTDSRPATPGPISQGQYAAQPGFNSLPPQMPPPMVSTLAGQAPPPKPVSAVQPIQPVSQRPMSTPPAASPVQPIQPIGGSLGRAATDPAAGAKSIRPATSQQSKRPDASLDDSLPPPKRGKGLIVFVLLVDLGLAGAGVWLLLQGLAK